MVKKVIDYFFGWELMYFTHRIDDYAKIQGKLVSAVVKHRTKCINHGNRPGSFGDFTTYEIWVNKNEMHKANAAMY